MNFGSVQRVLLDSKKGTFAIVEFDEELSARKAIAEGKIRINGVSFFHAFICVIRVELVIL